MAKIDIKAAYRLIPVHPADRWLLGMQFEGAIFMDMVLPFGLRSAPKIFNAVANALEWPVETMEWVICCITLMTLWCSVHPTRRSVQTT